MHYLYAIIDRPTGDLPALYGLADQPVGYIEQGQLAAAFSVAEPANARAEAAQILCHEAVVESLVVVGGALPVRFGTLLANEAALRELLCARHDSFVADLERVRGRVEVGLRVLWADSPTAPQPDTEPLSGCGAVGLLKASHSARGSGLSGRAYIERRLAEERVAAERRRRAEQAAEALHTRLVAYAEAGVCKLLPTERMLLSAAYLLPRSAVACFRARVAALAATRPDLRLLCTGPWPAYHFV